MATATDIQPTGAFCSLHLTRPSSPNCLKAVQKGSEISSAEQWASILEEGFSTRNSSFEPIPTQTLQYGLQAPRRKHIKDGALAHEIATLLYPAPADAELSQIIKYGRLSLSSETSLLY